LTLPKGYNSPGEQNFPTISNDYRLLVQPALVNRKVYEIDEITVEEDIENFDQIWKMAISSIELGNLIELLTLDGKPAYEIPIQALENVSLVAESKGTILKSTNLFVNFSYSKNGKHNQMKLDFRDDHAK